MVEKSDNGISYEIFDPRKADQIQACMLADSISPEGYRISTLALRYQRFIHSELMTHRMFSRNASSSRAIPVSKMMDMVSNNPAMPVRWGSNQPGMQAGETISYAMERQAKIKVAKLRDYAVRVSLELDQMGIHPLP